MDSTAALAGAAVTHRATSLESVTSALERHRETPPAPAASAIPPEVEAAALRQFYDHHYRDWLDEPIPALSNHTPRQSAQSKTLKPRLIELLKDFDSRSARAALEGRAAYDTSWLWSNLGLDRARVTS